MEIQRFDGFVLMRRSWGIDPSKLGCWWWLGRRACGRGDRHNERYFWKRARMFQVSSKPDALILFNPGLR
jgi:hypothetical protein